jgi:beta-glucosidase
MDTLISSADQVLKISVDVTNTSAIPGKEAVLWFISDHVGSITRPIKELAHFEKKLIQPGETISFAFNLNPRESLTFPDNTGNILLEDGSFDIQVGNLKKQFWLKRTKR